MPKTPGKPRKEVTVTIGPRKGALKAVGGSQSDHWNNTLANQAGLLSNEINGSSNFSDARNPIVCERCWNTEQGSDRKMVKAPKRVQGAFRVRQAPSCTATGSAHARRSGDATWVP